MTAATAITPAQLPAVIRGYLAAHEAHDTDAALAAFTPTAVVVDDGSTHRGTEEVRRFLWTAGAQFTYTTTLVSAGRCDDGQWVVTNRLEGDFPGGVVDLRYRFRLDAGLIAELVIAP
ncbi:nuclear transport factor 2 family protein [Blastococcus sp. URHD0036]|uniref:nuclear transport factor 2 family protein n=1 Tax=Blastococcus sp. URHD0036 TaxID=1380356 RepID=UPI000495ED84|nr:nuclear transport factor 2 family protein [Blastococcus sp. URHD0036]